MGRDVRIPVGLFFALLGSILTLYGLIADPQVFGRSLGINVDLIWGVVLLLFGLVLWRFGRRRPQG
jgi:hypothetical protein